MKFFVMLVLVVGLYSLTGCNAWKDGNAVRTLAEMGATASLDELKQNMDQYFVYRSGPVYNPAALLFVPKNQKYTVEVENRGMGIGWHSVPDQKVLGEMIRDIVDRDKIPAPLVKALVSPPLDQSGRRVLIGYIYSVKTTSTRKVEGKADTFLVRYIPEIPDRALFGSDGDRPFMRR